MGITDQQFMRLKDVVDHLDEYDDDQTIYASSHSPDADAVVAYESEDGQMPASARGLNYLLEIWIARDVVRVWSEWRGGQRPTLQDKLKAIVYYVENDSFQPIE